MTETALQDLYDRDLYAWTGEHPVLIEEIAIAHLARRREAGGRLAALLTYLLKWQFQPQQRKEAWRAAVIEQRAAIGAMVDASPGLAEHLVTALAPAYDRARRAAALDSGLPADLFPPACPFALADALSGILPPGPRSASQ